MSVSSVNPSGFSAQAEAPKLVREAVAKSRQDGVEKPEAAQAPEAKPDRSAVSEGVGRSVDVKS